MDDEVQELIVDLIDFADTVNESENNCLTLDVVVQFD
jgi:hypothetical protein